MAKKTAQNKLTDKQFTSKVLVHAPRTLDSKSRPDYQRTGYSTVRGTSLPVEKYVDLYT